jgi:hypothetical protein
MRCFLPREFFRVPEIFLNDLLRFNLATIAYDTG